MTIPQTFLLVITLFSIISASWNKEHCASHVDFPRSSQQHICLLVLTHEGPKTLKQTLDTYSKSGFLDSSFVKERLMFVNDYKEDEYDRFRDSIAAKYKFQTIKVNRHIEFEAISLAIKHCESDFFLFLEEDFKLHPQVNYTKEILQAMRVIDNGHAQGVRLRHRYEPGFPDYLCMRYKSIEDIPSPYVPDCLFQFGLNSYGDCILWPCGGHHSNSNTNSNGIDGGDHNMTCFNSLQYDKFYTPSKYTKARDVPFTNNPMLYHTSWYRKQIVEKFLDQGVNRINDCPGDGTCSNVSMEYVIQTSSLWWSKPGVTIARGLGLFVHDRIDRGRNVTEMLI